MRSRGRPSWEIRVDDPLVLAVALYVRDVAGVVQTAAPVDLPAVAPSVTPAPAVQALPEVTVQWNAWWARALATGPLAATELTPSDLSAFADAPALQDVLRRHLEAALRWSSGLRGSDAPLRTGRTLPLGELVSEVEHRTGRTAKPFRLQLDVVPVTGAASWAVDDAHLLVSSALAADPELLVPRLRPVVERLA